MPGSDIYRSTTEPVTGGYSRSSGNGRYTSVGGRGYLAKSSNRGCCPGRKKRNQYLVLFFSIFSVACGLTLLAVGCANGSLGIVSGLALFLVLGAVGGLLFVLYLRAIGRCNLPWWPSRAARISRTLIPSGPPEEELIAGPAAVPASATQLTLADPATHCGGNGGVAGHERSKLMEEPDTLEADKIAESEPKIVLQMPVEEASSKTA